MKKAKLRDSARPRGPKRHARSIRTVFRRSSGGAISATILFAALLSVFVISDTGQAATATTGEESHQNTVFVIDVSTSMYDIMEDLKLTLKEYVSESSQGDSIAIVTFGRSSQLHYRRTIHNSSDVKKVLEWCDELSCPDEYTYIACGLEAGIRELFRFCELDPSGKHQLVLMSDGLNHPPPNIEKPITYSDIEEKYFKIFEPGKEWFITYFALKGITDNSLADFVQKWGGFHWDPKKMERIAEIQIDPGLPESDRFLKLGTTGSPGGKKIPLFISPLKGYPEGMAVRVEPALMNIPPGADVEAHVRPSRFVCSASRIKQEFTLSVEGYCEGDINGVLRFFPEEKSFLLVYPTQLNFVLSKPPRLTVLQEGPIEAGPVRPGGEPLEIRLPLKLDGSLPLDDVSVRALPKIDLPRGLTCNVNLSLGGVGDEPNIVLTAYANDTIELGKQWLGDLVLESSSDCPIFSKSAIQLRVFTPPNVDEANPLLAYILIGMVSASVLGVLVVVGQKAYARRIIPLEGWLVVLEKPHGADASNIDLKKLSQEIGKKSLIIGRESKCDIRLRHGSVGKHHAEIFSKRRATTTIHLKSLAQSATKVNDFLLHEEVVLQDRDIVEFGEFCFLYSNSYLKQVVVHYKDGDVRYGVPLSWNIEEDGFTLRPEGKGAADLQVYIPFRDLKGVFFVKHFDKEIARKVNLPSIYAEKDHVVVKFQDGEVIEGFTIREYEPKAPRFLMVPKVSPDKEENNICILVERRFIEEIELVGKETAELQD